MPHRYNLQFERHCHAQYITPRSWTTYSRMEYRSPQSWLTHGRWAGGHVLLHTQSRSMNNSRLKGKPLRCSIEHMGHSTANHI